MFLTPWLQVLLIVALCMATFSLLLYNTQWKTPYEKRHSDSIVVVRSRTQVAIPPPRFASYDKQQSKPVPSSEYLIARSRQLIAAGSTTLRPAAYTDERVEDARQFVVCGRVTLIGPHSARDQRFVSFTAANIAVVDDGRAGFQEIYQSTCK